jgi:NAD dependent epimerase/dehydratase family enzyme
MRASRQGVLVLSVVAVAAAGCGSSGNGSSTAGAATPSKTTALTKSAYCQQLVAGPFNVKAPIPFNASKFAAAFGTALTQLKKLTPPPSLQSLQSQLVSAFANVVSGARNGNEASIVPDLQALAAARTQALKACQ